MSRRIEAAVLLVAIVVGWLLTPWLAMARHGTLDQQRLARIQKEHS